MNTPELTEALARLYQDGETAISKTAGRELDELQRTIAAKVATIERLQMFVKKFIDNFETCPNCENGDDEGETCFTCQGTGRRIASLGVLYIELPQDAAELDGTK